ncbi:MAG: hypothetical protein ACRDY2_12815 [Acidimicrobiales bacterium]
MGTSKGGTGTTRGPAVGFRIYDEVDWLGEWYEAECRDSALARRLSPLI